MIIWKKLGDLQKLPSLDLFYLSLYDKNEFIYHLGHKWFINRHCFFRGISMFIGQLLSLM